MSDFGIEGTTSEDTGSAGGRFSDVKKAVFSYPYRARWGRDGRTFPTYSVTLASVLKGLFSGAHLFRLAAERIVDSTAILRWGPDNRGFRRLLHPNGICLTGTWAISEDTPYSGYFRKGSLALVVARYSTCCGEVRRGHSRSLSLVGRLFPTGDPNDLRLLPQASFITQQDIGGERTDYINDAVLLNAPNTTVIRRGLGIGVILVTGLVFRRADKMPSIRQLYQIAELGKAPDEPTRAPTFMRLLVDEKQSRIEGEALDFRDEIMAQIYDAGDTASNKRKLCFHIEVTDKGQTRGLAIRERRTFENWKRIGTLTFDEAVASYNADFVLHFPHPTWRGDKDDPATETRQNGKKVRP
ncbi:hypothetical protein [Rhizobium leguminosarum]|uniref:hypothetical protein n=1 Tax=Rhizobium leguminosarum TaxID=384 RepID=UPI001442536C|nr:hypothetical protein [Rhizobium leguminosarum]NKL66285.1 hypothetical protein [Rhizobium leguminosarum bv. viciae]